MIRKLFDSEPLLILFLASIILFKIPNFYFLPFIQNAFFTTQSIARIIIVVIFVFKTFTFISSGKVIIANRESRFITFLIIILFLIQSLSITQAINYTSFLNRYKDIVLGVCSFFVFFYYKKDYLLIIIAIAFSVFFNALLQAILVFQPVIFLNLFSSILYQNYLTLLIANLDRGRFYMPMYDEILIPFLFIPEVWKKIHLKFSQIFFFVEIVFFALASNIRSNVLMLIIASLGSFFAFRKIALKKILLYGCVVLFLGYFVTIILTQFVGFSFYDRFTFQSKAEDVDTVTQRFTQLGQSFTMANSNLLGVGLGNYYDRAQGLKLAVSYSESRSNEIRAAQEYIHNIFGTMLAESGYPSVAVFILLLTIFAIKDATIIRGDKNHEKAFAIAFWVIFSWGLFNPPVSGTYQMLFWGFRGVLLLKPSSMNNL